MFKGGHAFLVEGDEGSLPEILDILRKNGEATRGPDAYVRSYRGFGVDDARELCSRAGSRPLEAARRVFVIIFASATAEAQNALLKTLEEPPAGALIVFVTPSPYLLLPTVRSRAQTVRLSASTTQKVDLDQFMKARPEARMELLKPLVEKDEDDERNIGPAVAFLAGLEEKLKDSITEKEGRAALRAIYRARSYIGDKGSLMKALLEQVALLVQTK